MSHEIARFMQNARVRLPGALDNTITLELFNVLDEFCQETNAWQEVIPITTVADETTYEIESREFRATIIRLLAVTMDGLPFGAFMPDPETLVFQEPPSGEHEYKATVALTVLDPVNVNDGIPEVPDWFFTNYQKVLLDGLLSKMMSQPAKPYFSQGGFQYHGRLFRNGMTSVRNAVTQQNMYGAQAWRFPPFAECRK